MRASAAKRLPLEYNLLLTATLCLLAFGAVMVYSASSARTLLQGQGDGTTYLVRYLVYGALGLVAMHVVARRGLDLVIRLTGPLLAGSFACLLAVKLPGLGIEVNGARRWLGAGPLVFQPSEVAKLALVLYAAKVLALKPATSAPRARPDRCCSSPGWRCCSSPPNPTSGPRSSSRSRSRRCSWPRASRCATSRSALRSSASSPCSTRSASRTVARA
jgi:hypothetical protein